MKSLGKFETSTLNRNELYNTFGGIVAEPKPVPPPPPTTGSTNSICHVDGKVDTDGTQPIS
jgi:hypothetical protein